MHDPEERFRLRWRVLAWAGAALILLPVLYVAVSGPMVWWGRYHYRVPQWHAEYARSLRPVYEFPEVGSMLAAYNTWWFKATAPRSWQRQRRVEQLASMRIQLESCLAQRSRYEAEARELEGRLRDLYPRWGVPYLLDEEADGLRRRLWQVEDLLTVPQSNLSRHPLGGITKKEAAIQKAEAALRRFDAQ